MVVHSASTRESTAEGSQMASWRSVSASTAIVLDMAACAVQSVHLLYLKFKRKVIYLTP